MRGSVEKRGKTYSIRLDLGKDESGKRRQKRLSGFKRKADAEAELVRIISEYNQGTYQEPTKETVASYFSTCLK